MKKNLQKLVKQLAEVSYKDGRMIESQVTKSVKALKSFPRNQAIEALLEYLKVLKVRERQHTMYLETVTSLSKSQINKIKKILEKRIKITKIVTNINMNILGGFKLRVGDEIWDETILGKVTQVKEALISSKSN